MKIKKHLIIFVLFMVLMSCVGAISAATDDTMNTMVSDADSSGDLISVSEIDSSDDLSSDYDGEQVIGVDENGSALIAQENDDSINGQSPINRQSSGEEIQFENSQILGVSEEDNNVLGDKQDPQLSFEKEVYELTGTSVTVKFILADASDVGGGANVPLDVFLDGNKVATKNYAPTSTYSSNRFKSADVSYGSHIVTVKFNGNDNYNEAEATCTLLRPLPITIDFDNSGNEAVFTLDTGTTDATGTFNVTLNGEKISEGTVSSGVGTATFDKIVDDGYYPFVIYYDIAGVKSTLNKGITIGVFDTQITFENDVYQLDGYSVYINFALVNASIIADGKDITFDVFIDNNPSSAKSYHAATDSYDSIYLSKYAVSGGIHNVTVRYNGNDNYNPSNASCKLIKPLDITVDLDNSGVDTVITFNTGTTDATGNFDVSLNDEKISEGTIENGLGTATFDKLTNPGYYPFVISYVLNGAYEGMGGKINKELKIPRELNLNNNSHWSSTGNGNKNSGKSDYARLNNVIISWMNNNTINFTADPLNDDYGTFSPSYSVVIDSEGTIFIEDDRGLYAFNNDGTLKYKSTSVSHNGGLTLYGDQIILSSCSIDYIRLMDSLTLQSFAGDWLGLSTASRFPAVVGPDGRVYIVATWQDTATNKWITALKYNGEKFSLDTYYYKDTSVSAYSAPSPVSAVPVFTDDGIMWVPTDEGIRAINVSSDSQIFSNAVGVSGRPVVDDNNIVYYLGTDNQIYALTLEYVMNATVTGGVGTTLAVDTENALLYAVNKDGILYKYGTDDLTEELVANVGSAGQSIIIDANNVYVSTVNGDVYAFDSEGNELWSINLGSSILGQLAMDKNGIIYAFTADTIYALGYRNETELIFEVEENYTTLDNITFTASINSTFDGENITFTIVSDNGYENTTDITIADGQAVFNVGALKEGNYTVTASYAGNTYYAEASVDNDFEVSKVAPELSVNIINATVFTNASITVTSTNCKGNVSVKIGDEFTKDDVVIGEELVLPLLPLGVYDVTVTYAADDIYTEAVNDTEQLEITKEETMVEPYVNEDGSEVTLSFEGMESGIVFLDVEGTGYYASIEDGMATFNIDGLEPGNHTATVTYPGDENYKNTTFDINIEVPELLDPELDVTADGSVVIVSLNENATGYVVVSVDYEDLYFDYEGEAIVVEFADLESGNYTVDVFYSGDDYFVSDSASVNLTVPEVEPIDPEFNVTVDGSVVTVSLDEYAGGYVVVSVDDLDLFFEYEGGDIVVDLADYLEPDNYTVDVAYSGDDYYASANATVEVTVPEVEPLDPELDVAVNGTVVTISLNENATGYVVVGIVDDMNQFFEYDGEPIDVDFDGLQPGDYTVEVFYSGDEYFAQANATVIVTIPEVEPEDPELKAFAEGSDVIITLNEDATGMVLVGLDDVVLFFPALGEPIIVDLSFLIPGNYTVAIKYLGDEVFAPANATVTVTIPEDEKKDAGLKASVSGTELTVSLNKNATGYVLAGVEGGLLFYEYEGKDIVVDLSYLEAGNYTIIVLYSGDEAFYPGETSANVTIPEEPVVEPKDPNLKATAVNNTITATVDKDVTGNVLVDVAGQGYYAPIKDGKAIIDVIGLDEGKYQATVTYAGDDVYKAANATVSITVPKKEDPAPEPVDPKADIKIDNGTVSAELPKDATGYMLVDVDGTGYYAPVKDGKASLDLPELAPGNHTVTVTYTGDKKYDSANATKTIEVEAPVETIISENLTKVEKSPARFEANFTDATGKALANTDVKFIISGTTYTRTTDANGKAGMNINLPAGNYSVTVVNPVTNESKVNTITVLPRLEANDLTKYFKNASQFRVKVFDDNGNPVKAGEVVTFNINGVFYNRTTDKDGYAQLSINLIDGDYVITSEYKGCKASNNIKVLPILTAKDLTKQYGKAGAFEATLVDGQGKPYANQQVEFNINGVFYKRTTGSNGVAKLNINLPAGKYIVTSSYGGFNIANTVTVTA